MRLQLANLLHNLAAGLRLALFRPVDKLAFRIDLAQLLLLFVFSAALDVGVDWIRYGPDAYFSWYGLGNEIFGAGVLLLAAAVLAHAFGDRTLALSLPVVVLAAIPLLQLMRLLPGVAIPLIPSELFWSYFDRLWMIWIFVVFMRAVGVTLAPVARGRWWRLLVGAFVLFAPIWFAPLIAPNDAWWKEEGSDSVADPRYPNPASEPVIAAQQHLLDEALSNLDDERPNVTDLYFVGFAGDGNEDVFRKDVLAAQKVMDERWGTEGRSVALINNRRTLLEVPEATVTNLREALNEIGAAIDVENDVVMVYLASHGSSNHVLEVALPPLELAQLTPPMLKGLLDGAGIKWRIIVVSACYSGGFIDALQDENTLVLTASQADRASFGCGNASDSTYFGEALFQQGLAQADSLLAAFEAARVRVAEREKAAGLRPPSNPQSFVGQAMADKLKELDRGNAARRAGRSV